MQAARSVAYPISATLGGGRAREANQIGTKCPVVRRNESSVPYLKPRRGAIAKRGGLHPFLCQPPKTISLLQARRKIHLCRHLHHNDCCLLFAFVHMVSATSSVAFKALDLCPTYVVGFMVIVLRYSLSAFVHPRASRGSFSL